MLTNHTQVKHADQYVILMNALLSDHVRNGNIDLTGEKDVFVPEVSSEEFSEDEKEEEQRSLIDIY